MDPVTLRRGLPRALACLLALGVAGALGSCANPFTPAEPEQPTTLTVPQDFSTVDASLGTMAAAIKAGANGADAWLAAYADSNNATDRAYHALYDPAILSVAVGSGVTVPPWEKRYEPHFFTYLQSLKNSYAYQLNWQADPESPNDEIPQNVEGDTVLVHRRYVLIAARTAQALATAPDTLSVGRCDLSLQYVSARWSIFRWTDHVVSSIGAGNSQLVCASKRRIESLSQ